VADDYDDEEAASRGRPNPPLPKPVRSSTDSTKRTPLGGGIAAAVGRKPPVFAGGQGSDFDVLEVAGNHDIQGSPTTQTSSSSVLRPDSSKRGKGEGESAEELAESRRERFEDAGIAGPHPEQGIQESPSPRTASAEVNEQPDTLQATATVGPTPKVFVSHPSEDHADGLSDGLNLSGGDRESPETTATGSLPQQLSLTRDPGRAEAIAARDALDRGALTRAVADFLTSRTDEHALALALFGAWGSGKSSFIDFLRKELTSRQSPMNFRFAEFNAWKNERVDNIGAALAQSVVTELVSKLTLFEQFKLAVKIAHKRTQRFRKALVDDAHRAGQAAKGNWFDWLTVLGPLVVWPLLTAAMLYAVFEGTAAVEWLSRTTAAVGAAISAVYSASRVLSKQLLNWFKDLAKDKKFSFKFLPDYSEKLGSFHEMGETLGDLVHLSLTSQAGHRRECLMLVVDDLDRCSPDTIKQVFDAVRLVAHIPNVVVLVALDERIAYTAVAKHYADYGRDPALVARDYLAKVFNLFVTLPMASPESISSYVRSHLFTRTPQRVEESGLEQQPRSVDEGESPTPARPSADLESTSTLEVETFAGLVQAWGLANPRELWRLRQTWALLKGVALQEHVSEADVRIWMRHMFFREMFLQGNEKQRKAVEDILNRKVGADAEESMKDARVQLLARTAAEIAFGFNERDPKVMAVLLPAAPYDLKALSVK